MEKFLLDTNICIFLLKEKYAVKQKIDKIGYANCYISEITLAELAYGAEYSLDPDKNLLQVNNFRKKVTIIPISNAIALYAKEKAQLRRKGMLIDDMDIFIGATAVANNMVLVTENEKHLNRLSNIKIENWIKR
ncbi:MAG: type II toxin-antitoxin system VapC family toxin [Dysgonamonadaceae bacterium]|jgi:tRNA(fMet)-specific endonuclease VapC|nr:type II toxin-antitoxin system VapC family toxin [Dysgonamonadaceae bacterium]